MKKHEALKLLTLFMEYNKEQLNEYLKLGVSYEKSSRLVLESSVNETCLGFIQQLDLQDSGTLLSFEKHQ